MDCFIVEVDRRAVGIAIRVPGGFRFVCSDRDFRSLDSKIFPRARTLASGVTEFARARRAQATVVH